MPSKSSIGIAGIWVGDRFVCNDIYITITRIDREHCMAEYTTLNPDTGVLWSSRTSNIPSDWVRTGRGVPDVVTCVSCGQADAEPGSIYCDTCMVNHAGEWAGLSEDEAMAKTQLLIEAARRVKEKEKR